MKNVISKHIHWIIYGLAISLILGASIYLGEIHRP
jgi:hypothetical protein